MSRRSGVLMAVSSLPSPYGIGDFGEGAYRFVEKLADMGFKLWQVLPLNHPDSYGSPYTSISAFAVSPLYVSPTGLVSAGLVTGEEAARCEYSGSPYTSDYAFAKNTKSQLLRLGFSRAGNLKNQIEAFAQNNPWVKDYALYCALKDKNGGSCWSEWPENERVYSRMTISSELCDRVDYYLFEQYILWQQWSDLRRYANQNGVKIVGDMPIYVSYDSADVWSNTPYFMIDPVSFKQTESAGVPPDYFSEKGQLWGNPIYDWATLKRDGFSWWKQRIDRALELYDTVRIDHFRGLASYYSVEPDAPDAINGVWKKGPGMDLFNALDTDYKTHLIAEDLGIFGEDVQQLLETTELPGMRVVQFGFTGDKESIHLPHNYPKNSVAYVGTHDNSTILGWLWEANENERRYLLDYCGFTGDWGAGGFKSAVCRSIIETVWRSAADTVIVAFQDMCGFGNDARMNIPGEAEKSWKFRTTAETVESVDTRYFRRINSTFSR